jgi:hypothetical protein
MFRHGDILIAPVAALPESAKCRATTVLARGELTGHSHRIEDATKAALWDYRGEMFVQVTAPSVRLVHQEHKAIILPQGCYRFWFQREYTPQAIRRVID